MSEENFCIWIPDKVNVEEVTEEDKKGKYQKYYYMQNTIRRRTYSKALLCTKIESFTVKITGRKTDISKMHLFGSVCFRNVFKAFAYNKIEIMR